MSRKFCFLLIIVLMFSIIGVNKTKVNAVSHPFLLLRSSDFSEMQNRADTSPWKEMKQDAISISNAGVSLDSNDKRENCDRLSLYIDATALAYILDPANKSTYVARVKDAILNKLDQLAISESNWNEVIPPANTLFTAIIALDTIYNDISSGDRTACENKIQSKVSIINKEGSWTAGRLALHGVWDIYRGVRTTPDDEYYKVILSDAGTAGVPYLSPGYVNTRFNGNDRYLKALYMDILEHTGIDKRYYNNPNIIGAYEWLYGYSHTPFKRPVIIGDTAIHSSAYSNKQGGVPSYRARKFSDEAAKYASWLNEGLNRAGRLLNYVIPDAALPQATVTQKSMISLDGGGFFREGTASGDGLMGVLYNTKGLGQHSHRETNAIYLAGYGEHLLLNSGYAGYNTGVTITRQPEIAIISSSSRLYTIGSTADAYVRDGTYANNNYGTAASMVVKSDNTNYNRKAYIKFNFSEVKETTVSSAKLRLYVTEINKDPTRTIKIYGVNNDNWSETGITWNNAPAGSVLIGSINVTQAGVWYEIDITNFVNSNMSDKVVSFLLVNEGAPSSEGGCVFSTREARTASYSWGYIHATDYSGNTLNTERNSHSLKYGNGLQEGFTSVYFDYACGDDGSALADDTHYRSLMFVHPQDGKNGYFIMQDEVTTKAGGQIFTYLHPNTRSSTGISTVSSKTEYRADINGYVFNKSDVKLNIFYATAPNSVQQQDGAIAGFGKSFEGKYLKAGYSADSSGKKQILTILFPSDSTHAKASMSRISGSGYTGASVNHGNNIIDYAFESPGTSTISHNGTSFRGKSVVFRKISSKTVFYFVRKGRSFDDGNGYGFSSTADVSIHLRDKTGNIAVASNTDVTFYYPGIKGVYVNGIPAANKNSGSGYVTITVTPGTKSIELSTDTLPGASVFNPNADAYVRDGSYANSNYGTAAALIVKADNTNYKRKAYVKFNFSSFQGSATNAKLRLYVSAVNEDPVRTIKVYGVNNDSWTETGITWSNAPSGSTYIGAIYVMQNESWYEIDVTDFVNSNLSDKTVTFLLINEGLAGSKTDCQFNSREAGSNKPELAMY